MWRWGIAPLSSSCTERVRCRHLMDMGLIKGTAFKVVKVAPLGDPVQITVRGYELSIRKEEAAIVEVE